MNQEELLLLQWLFGASERRLNPFDVKPVTSFIRPVLQFVVMRSVEEPSDRVRAKLREETE